MKQWVIALFAMGVSFTLQAQTNAPGPAAPAVGTPALEAPSAPSEPKSTTNPDNTRYTKDPNLIIACQAEVAAFVNKPCDIIFIGDSATAGWRGAGRDVWAKTYAGRKALNFGVVGDKIQNVLWRLGNMEIQNLKPKVVVLQIGGSNADNTAHEIADGIKNLLTNIQISFPGVKIILVSPIPSDLDHDKMTQVNSLTRNIADNSNVYYLNLYSLMPMVSTTNPDGTVETNWKGLDRDHLHLAPQGYQIWADGMEPLLKKLL